MAKKKKIKGKLGAPSDKIKRDLKKKRNPFLNRKGGFDLIDRFPVYKEKRDKKQKKE